MTPEAREDILQAILRDDPKAFDEATGKHKNLCMGRFSLLAVCYLYGSRKILSAYAKAMRQGNPVVLDEPRQIYNDFARVAGKALRLWAGYVHEEVHPLAMLAVLGDWHTLRHEYPTYVLSEIEQKRLLDAVKLRYGVAARIENGRLTLPPKPVAQSTKVKLVALLSLAVLVAVSAVALLSVSLVYGAGIPVTTLEALGSMEEGKQYALRKDVTLDGPIDWGGARVNGGGHTITVKVSDTPALTTFAGTVENCTIKLVGSDIKISESYACLALRNEGTWRNVHFLFEGEEGWCVSLDGFERNEEGHADACRFGALFVENAGLIEGCTLSGDLRWVGQGVVDGELGAYASCNAGTIRGCTLESNLLADTIDLGGFVFRNEKEGVVEDCTLAEGYAVAQVTSVYEWSPKTGGIAALNYGVIANAAVYGGVSCGKQNVTYTEEKISATMVSVGGVCSNNYGTVRHAQVVGNVQGYGDYTVAYVGGVCSDNYYAAESGEDKAILSQNVVVGTVIGAGYYTYVGGLCGASSGYLDANCFNGLIDYSQASSPMTYAGTALGYGNFADEDVPALFTDNHVVRLYYQSMFGGLSTLSVVGFYEQAGSAVSSLVGVTEHDSLDFANLEAYWYGK